MKTTQELQQNIIDITNKIQTEYPELMKFISEMPVNNQENQDVNVKSLENYYQSLHDTLKKYSKTHIDKDDTLKNESHKYADLQIYPPSEDIYRQFKEEKDLNPEDITKRKTPNEQPDTPNEKSFADAMTGSDLDVPGSEYDDQQESIGSEDEENNYYSLGGDNHNDLEEDNV